MRVDERDAPDWLRERAEQEEWGHEQWREWDRLRARLSELGTELEDIELRSNATTTLFAFSPFVTIDLDDTDRYPLLKATHRLVAAVVDPQPVRCSKCGRVPTEDEKRLKLKGWHRAGSLGQRWRCPDCWRPPEVG
ncbi:MAG TPA: hypothetical protein VI409_02775 [Gaiellaceae bacterium]|nr:hypothetical protein [Gaiellaceae bacterium]